jgi:hypothetical protein
MVSRQAEGYPAELAEPGYGARVCISKLCCGLESDVESHRGQVGDVVADLSLGDHAAGVVVVAEVVESGGGVGE